MATEISKSQLVSLLQEDDAIEYEGKIQINSEMRLYYRTRIGAANEEKGYKLVYIVE